MANKITYTDKIAIQNDTTVPDESKVTDDNMNEIKQVVNNNADEVAEIQKNIEDLQGGQGTADTDIASLKNRVNTLETDNTKNKSDINILKNDNETNKFNIEELQEDNIQNKTDITDIKEEQETQNEKINTSITKNEAQDELISKLKNALINAETEEAKSLHVEDANKFGQLEVLGNQEQETREGYNLLQNKLTDTTINGVTFKINEDKSVTVNGTATASIIANLITGEYNDNNATEPLIIPDNITNCRLSGCPSGGSSSTYKLDIYNQKYDLLATDWGEGTNVTIDSQEDKKIARVRIIIYSGATVNNLTFKPMLVAGTEEREYEQYGASPSPEYPSPVKCLGSNKNILDTSLIQETTKGGITSKINSDGSITFDGVCDVDNNVFDFFIENQTKFMFKAITKKTAISAFYVSGNITDENNKGAFFRICDSNYNGGNIDLTSLPAEKIMTHIYNSTSGNVFCDIRIDKNVVLDNFTIKVKAANTLEDALTYSPYGQGSTEIKMKNADETQEKSYTLPIQQEMLKGDYFIKEDDGWKEVHNWNKLILTGDESYNNNVNYINVGRFGIYLSLPAELGSITNPNAISNYYKSEFAVENGNVYVSGVDEIVYMINENFKGDLEGFKQQLRLYYQENKPVYIYYVLKTPTKLPCTEAQSALLEELSNLDLFEGVNNIITAEDIALLKLKYALDVKSYVDNKIASLITQTTEATQEETI